MPSDEMFEEINTVSYLICVFTNPWLFSFDDLGIDENLPQPEKTVFYYDKVQILKGFMEELMCG